jgi:hypothetical protein
MSIFKRTLFGVLLGVLACGSAHATERLFTYTYEPETMPQGATEFENWVTLRTIRNDEVGQEHYTRWDLRQELEYGVTDNYTLSMYLNEKSEYFRDPATHEKTSEFQFDGVSLENKWMALNPAEHPIGLSLYLEPRIANGEWELEEKIILGQRFGKNQEWKWAFNATHATEWVDSEDPDEGIETEGELEFTFGLTREINKNWHLGFEFRNHNEIPEYEEWEHTAFFVGPVVTYQTDKWWVTVTAMGQVYGKNYLDPDPDGESNFVLDEHEYLNVRCIIGIDF